MCISGLNRREPELTQEKHQLRIGYGKHLCGEVSDARNPVSELRSCRGHRANATPLPEAA